MKTFVQKFWIVLAMLWLSMSASAYDFEVDGIYYNITSMGNLEVEVTYRWINQTFINGVGSYENQTSYTGKIVIPETVNYNNRTFNVVGIGKAAFGYPKNIGNGSYDYSSASSWGIPTKIDAVELPQTLEYIDDMAFQGCNITSISIPDRVKIIGTAAFAYTMITTASVTTSDIVLSKEAFCGTHMNTLVLGHAKSIGQDCFKNCSFLMEVFCTSSELPEGLSTSSFTGAHSALEIYVPSKTIYGFGNEYLTFPVTSYEYTGQGHNIEWNNNLRAYKCTVPETDCVSEVNAGTYTQYLKATYSNGVDFTVEIPYTYNIKKAPMSLTVQNVEREYGEPNPAFTCNISGFVNGENEQTLGTTPSFDCDATVTSKVGDYRIIASLNAPNYEVTYKYGTLTVVKAPLALTVTDATRIYGNDNPDFLLSYSGLKLGESMPDWVTKPSITTDATVSSNVGQYTVNVSGGNPVNYNITKYNPGTLTVTKRDLSVKANDCERLYGEENPVFDITYIGFVNGDSENSLTKKPIVECMATKSSDAGKYPIVVTGGDAENYNLTYQDGFLTIKPLTVGFKEVYNSVMYNDMAVSTNERYFNYIPEIIGPFSEEDFGFELWALDKDNKFPQHVISIVGGDYEGDYINTSVDRQMYAGKYIINLIPKRTNPNVVADPARAYLTVNRASNNLSWNTESPITVEVGDTIDLGISYQADLWCDIKLDYNDELIELSSKGEKSNDPHWYAIGLEEGETILYFSIECRKNDWGFYDFTDSQVLSKRIIVEHSSGVESIVGDDNTPRVAVRNNSVYIYNKAAEAVVRVYTLQGTLVAQTTENAVNYLNQGLYIVAVGNKSFKIKI